MVRFGLFAATLLLVTVVGWEARADAGDRRDDFAAPKVNEGAIPETKVGADPGKAVVIVGLAATDANEANLYAGLRFRVVDTASDKFFHDWLPGKQLPAFTVSKKTHKQYIISDRIDPTVIEYLTVEVPPGDWILTEIVTQGRGNSHTTHLTTQKVERYGHRSSKLPYEPADALGPRLTVAAGEVVYIGTFVVDVVKFPARLVRFWRDEAGAKAAMAKSPDLQAKLVTRDMTWKKAAQRP